MSRIVVAIALALPWSVSAQTAVAPQVSADPQLVAAIANKALIKVRPELKSGAAPTLSDQEREAGHNGVVLVSAIVEADGRLSHTTVAQSSGAPTLDALALEAARASTFSPARDAKGGVIVVSANVAYEFGDYTLDDPARNLMNYKCEQFIKDLDWWRSAFPNAKIGDFRPHLRLSGISMLSVIRSPGGLSSIDSIRANSAAFATHWDKAVEGCRARPTSRLADELQPEGKYLDALAAAAARQK